MELIQKISSGFIQSIIVFCVCTPLMLMALFSREITPELHFPQPGLDDTATYRDYTTRFFRDTKGNTVQIILNAGNGRIMHIWADAANESMAFTARDSLGEPAQIEWGAYNAEIFQRGTTRYLQHWLISETPVLEIGHFMLGSMRVERDFQYAERHLQPFDSQPFIEEELRELMNILEQLPPDIQNRHLNLLKARNIESLHSRLIPNIIIRNEGSQQIVRISKLTFDARNQLSMEFIIDTTMADVVLSNNRFSIHFKENQPAAFGVRIATDSPVLTPIYREDMFNDDFMNFYRQLAVQSDSLQQQTGSGEPDSAAQNKIRRFRWLERQVKSLELLSFEEKLMAGLPNFATYFGRDMIMSALMLEPVWKPEMLEHVISSVLRKLSPTGEVSHEEGLGGQAIRENADRYNQLIRRYQQLNISKTREVADSIVALSEKILENLQTVTENYRMVDDDFQFPVLVARYFSRTDIPDNRKQSFLQTKETIQIFETSRQQGNTRLQLLLKNLLFISRASHPYVLNPTATNLVSFIPLDDSGWIPGSWRDSNAGYAHGRFAMDVNALWVPHALESLNIIFASLRKMGYTADELQKLVPEIKNSPLLNYFSNPLALQQATNIWQQAQHHFEVHMDTSQIRRNVEEKLNWLPQKERDYWAGIFNNYDLPDEGLNFLAVALDETGQPIPVSNSDPATWIFLQDFTAEINTGELAVEDVLKWFKIFTEPYPVGLFVKEIGPLSANDVFASKIIWELFRQDRYHSPYVVWGREVNLLFLGIGKQLILAMDKTEPHADLQRFTTELRTILAKNIRAVENSGLKHNELWGYAIENGTLRPARYPTSTDIQLWNLTNLAVEFIFNKIPANE